MVVVAMNTSNRLVVAHNVKARRLTAQDFMVGEAGGRSGKLLNLRMQKEMHRV